MYIRVPSYSAWLLGCVGHMAPGGSVRAQKEAGARRCQYFFFALEALRVKCAREAKEQMSKGEAQKCLHSKGVFAHKKGAHKDNHAPDRHRPALVLAPLSLCVHCEFAPACLVSRWLPSTDARLLCCARLCCCSMMDPKPHLLFHPAHPSTTPDRLGWSLCLRLLQRQRGRFGPYFGAKYTPPPFFCFDPGRHGAMNTRLGCSAGLMTGDAQLTHLG